MEKYNGYMSLEREFNDINKEIESILIKTQAYMTLVEHVYRDIDKQNEDFVSEMQMTQSVLLRLVNKLNDIGMKAMAENNNAVYYKCEDVKLKVRNTMETVRNLYM
jgi:hypothetical protein